MIKQYCLDQADEHCDRVAQFLKELIDAIDIYVRDATYLLSRVDRIIGLLSNNEIIYVLRTVTLLMNVVILCNCCSCMFCLCVYL